MSAQDTIGKGIGGKRTAQSEAARTQYLAHLPEDRLALHRLMKVLEVGGLAVIAAALSAAMYVSINYRQVAPITIATAWFAFPVSLTPLMILLGAHAIAVGAYFPVSVPGTRQRFVTGSSAVWLGAGQVVTGLATALFWGAFAWAVRTGNVASIGIYVRVLCAVMAVSIMVSFAVSIVGKLVRR
jgi:hypothetical protein